jgi:hypothetical protein
MELKPGSEIEPGTKVLITIEATVVHAIEDGPVHVTYGEDGEHMIAITRFDQRNGVTIRTA